MTIRIVFSFFCLLSATSSVAMAAAGSVTYFVDGALVETEARASKGIASIPVPAGMLENSLRIQPLSGTAIRQVDMLSAPIEDRGAKELELLEQKQRLEDRLKALATREEVFKSAAKSQGGKAPRKTKANPDPMQSIRQGTEFAIAQLEAVYTARRRAEAELRRMDAKIAALRTAPANGGDMARVSVSPHNGRIRASYALTGYRWTPRYDLRLDHSGLARLILYGQVSDTFSGYLAQAANAPLDEAGMARRAPVDSGLVRLGEYLLPVNRQEFGSGIRTSFSCVMTNTAKLYLPPGDMALYRDGAYLGRIRFQGISSGQIRRIGS